MNPRTVPLEEYMTMKGYWEDMRDKDSLKVQVGGSHYKDMPIQPIEFIIANDLGFVEGNIIKYTCRYKQKGGVEDLKKVKHYVQMLIDKEEDSKCGLL